MSYFKRLLDPTGATSLRRIGIIVILSNLTFAALMIVIVLNGEEMSRRRHQYLAIVGGAFSAENDSLQITRKKLEQMIKDMEGRIARMRVAADSLSFEISSRQATSASLDTELSQLRLRLAEERAARVQQMAGIMASSSPEAIEKMSAGLDDSLLAKIVTSSNKREAAKILAALNAERAAQVIRELTRSHASH